MQELQRQQLVIQELTDQVQRLQEKLGDLHATDINSLRRAYKTLTQHVEALDLESKPLASLIQEIETNLMTPTSVANDIGFMASMAAASYTINRVIKLMNIPDIEPVARLATLAGVCLVGWRLVTSTGTRVTRMLLRNRRAKAQLQQEWKNIHQRVEVMVQLAQSGLAAHPYAASQVGPQPNSASSSSNGSSVQLF